MVVFARQLRIRDPGSRIGGPLLSAVAIASLVVVGCGKKGPPLAPFVRVPAAVDQIDARRVGNDIYVTLTVPAVNVDNFKPADVGRVDVYAYTGTTPPPRGRFLEFAAPVGSVDVLPPVLPGNDTTAQAPPPRGAGAAQGSTATVRDTLTADELVAVPIPPPTRETTSVVTPVAVQAAGPLRRFYMAQAVSDRGRGGPLGRIIEVPLTPLPDPPLGLHITYSADALSLSWGPSGGLIGFLLEPGSGPELPPFDVAPSPPSAAGSSAAAELPAGPTRYNVYRYLSPDPLALPTLEEPADVLPQRPLPVNAMPLGELGYVEELLAIDERQHCYAVAAVRGVEPNLVEGEPSATSCVTLVDVFPPMTPTGLSAIGAEGVISLIWEPNAEVDFAGYMVLRGEAGSATLAPLTDTVIHEARFSDRDVQPGVRYVYAVVALDNRVPLPNVSDESNRVEETAR